VPIVVLGGTGLLGSGLVADLRRAGREVRVLTRRPRQPGDVLWESAAPLETLASVLAGADAVVNLAGAPIARRWTRTHKQAIVESRVASTQRLADAIAATSPRPPVLLSASAIGIYGPRGDEPLTETDAPGKGFLAATGVAWEHAALTAAPATRVVVLRTGIVLDRRGGALPPMALPFRLFVGGRLGSGRQYVSWIHVQDWIAIVRWALAHDAVSGPINLTAPNPVTNLELTHALARVLHRPALCPVPAFVLRLVLGEMADAVLTGQRVLPAKATALGFTFRYPELDGALRAELG
jgi:uncharacterized protein (TIGR01777 family)